MHIVVNRTHPYTQKVIQPHRGFDIDAAHKIIAEIEDKQGWAPQENARYRVNEQGYVVRNLRHRTQVKPKPKAEDFENATGEKSVQRIAQERGHAGIQNATCWEELHAGLDAGRSAFRAQRLRRGDFRGRHDGQGVQRGQEFFHVQALQTAWRVQARLLLPADIPQARSGAGQSRLPGEMAGVSEGTAEAG